MRRIALLLILVVAAAARVWYLTAGVPHAVPIDEPHIVDRAMRILQTGDWNTQFFEYPSLVIYLQAVVAILRFLWGAVNGEWNSLDAYSISAVYTAGRLVTAAIAVLTVWLTYRLGAALGSRTVGLLAAAQLAAAPMHIRQSHLILPDVPMAALTTLAIYLAQRALRLGTVRAYAWAGCACGLAAATKYVGAIALVAVLAAWLVDRRMTHRGRTLVAALAAAGLAFLAGAPYTLLDMPGFLNGIAGQLARRAIGAAGETRTAYDALHVLITGSGVMVLFAVAGALMMVWRRTMRRRAAPLLAFVAAYGYLVASQAWASAGDMLPLLPPLVVLAAAAAVAGINALLERPAFQRPAMPAVLAGLAMVLLLWVPTHASVQWIDAERRLDTRMMAAEWLTNNAPRHATVAIDAGGPLYLQSAGFKVVSGTAPLDRPLDWYQRNAEYLVLTTPDQPGYEPYVGGGRIVFQVAPGPQRFGPPIVVIALR